MAPSVRLIDEVKLNLPEYRWLEEPLSNGKKVTCGNKPQQISIEQAEGGYKIEITFADSTPPIKWLDGRPVEGFAKILKHHLQWYKWKEIKGGFK